MEFRLILNVYSYTSYCYKYSYAPKFELVYDWFMTEHLKVL